MPLFTEQTEHGWIQREIPNHDGSQPEKPPTPPAYYLGLDLGQTHDYTALSIAQRHGEHGKDPSYHVRDIRRWPLNTSYLTIVSDVTALIARPPLAGVCVLVVDQTGVGRAVGDMLVRQQLRCRAYFFVTIHGGDAISQNGREIHVPKRDLVAAVQVCLQGQRLKVAAALPEAATLVQEFQGFQYKLSAAGYDSYGAWREGAHDDVLLATALAVWASEYGLPYEVKFW